MTRNVLLLAALFAFVPSGVSAQCVEVSDTSFSLSKSDYGLSKIVWKALLTNGCEAVYDVDLMANFLNTKDDPIYRLRSYASVGAGRKVRVVKDSHIPDRYHDKIVGLGVKITDTRKRVY
ncbi:hypothetical protein [Thiohalomonas denitrificans]|uniref:Uncharacterized protein n=1 Tax=Thiohalomonas denitrificans TaxID=415747 RepID=A0A1G5PJ85_9GAMM|nr:hypothetical protein [Thiohalomonas denitrificans]SCZ49575.1 hypothetical protein SAMN03097708_00199 [Thiohalomonas denitrificans]